MKLCIDCQISKPFADFTKKTSCTDGYEPRCKVCRSIKYNKSSLELVAKKIYNSQKLNSKKRNHPEPSYNLDTLIEWLKANPLWPSLYNAWVSSAFTKNLAPSIDRIDVSQPYTLSNIRLTTWEDNFKKGRQDILQGNDPRQLKPVRACNSAGQHHKDYISLSEAARDVKGSYWGIVTVANGIPIKDGKGKLYQPRTYKGYVWSWL